MTRARAVGGAAVGLVLAWWGWPWNAPDVSPEPRSAPVAASLTPRSSLAAPPEVTSPPPPAPQLPAPQLPAPSATDAGDALDAQGRAVIEANAAAAARAVERFCEESDRARHVIAVLPPAGHAADAASFLSNRVAFDGHPGALTLPSALQTAMEDSAWRGFDGSELKGLDFGWMQQLLSFDHWSLESTNVFHDAPGGLLDAPEPDYGQLQLWVKLRLVKGRADGDLTQATSEVLHLAGLVRSSDTLLARMVATSMVGIVDSFWRDVGRAPPTPLPDDAERTRYRKALVIAPLFLWPGVDPKVRARALGCMVDPCSALTEAVNVNAVVGDLEGAARLTAGVKGCDTRLLERVARAPVVGPRALAAEHEASAIDDWVAALGR
ncbi:MAG: hypothetical protein ACOZQL_04280 [Myxococcota bacterium]